MPRVAYAELESALLRGVERLGLTGERAALCARLFAETTRDGVYTHGLNRLPRMAAMVRNGSI
ncbi:MAG: Ldh family oxidoreductase, partial [Acidobacteriota bacterium]|nr:Ldh family oxidoreductase [Acidobacteriota bacterium]